MSVRGHASVYILGNFARYVTVYAQQVRALNLVDSLAKSGRLSARSRVAVIGGGISGLTAAAALAVRGVDKVTVFEREQHTMRIQRSSHTRWLHPHIYDWPIQSDFGPDAELPIMSWKADYASEVVRHLDKQWLDICTKVGPKLEPIRLGVRKISLNSEGEKPVILSDNHPEVTFDAVIIAIGFGLDHHASTFGYWADAPWDNVEMDAAGKCFLVSGAGDGALTDLMRLCFLDFKHGDALATVDAATRREVGQDLLEAERSVSSSDDAQAGNLLGPHYTKAAERIADALDKAPELKPRQLTKVWLNCPPGRLFGRSSSILNRLITAYLLHRERFQLIGDYLETIDPTSDGKFKVAFKTNVHPAVLVDHVIVRHGPDNPRGPDGVPRTWTPFNEIWKSARQLRREWSEMRQQMDWTREPLYSHGDFETATRQPVPLRVDFAEDVGCVVVTGSRTPAGLNQARRVEDALRRFARQLGRDQISGRRLRTYPEIINAEAALESSAAYERAVRALCDADIAVFDVSGFESIVMLLLGIRAAVRRGVTVTITQDDPKSKALPFNLATLNPILIGKNDIDAIMNAFVQAFSSLKARFDYYLDLPVYDAVRRLGRDFIPLEPSEQVLILRWFDQQYADLVSQLVESPLLENFERPDRKIKIVTTLDSSSPQLVDQRLYAAIRRTDFCIADWTGWRPNVFFEIGVRLAVNEIDPIFIYCKSKPPGWNDAISHWPSECTEESEPGSRALMEFFKPVTFDFSDRAELHGFIEGISKSRAEPELQETLSDSPSYGTSRRAGAKLSPGRTYKVVVESIDRHNEPGGKSVFDHLLMEAEMLAGPAVTEEGRLPVLYSDVLAEQVRRLAADYLITLWYAEDGRHKLTKSIANGTFVSDGESLNRLRRLRRIGEQLRDRLRNVARSEFRRERDEISLAMDLIEQQLGGPHG